MMDHTSFFQPADQITITDLSTLKLYFDPLRARLITLMITAPRSVSQLADQLQVPFTRLYYHIRLLEKHGLIVLVEQRVILGGVKEKFYRAAARNYIIDRSLSQITNPDGTNPFLEEVFATVIEAAKDDLRLSVRRGVADLTQTPPAPKALLLRSGLLNATNEQAVAIQQRLLDLLLDVCREPFPGVQAQTDEQFYQITVMFNPVVKSQMKP